VLRQLVKKMSGVALLVGLGAISLPAQAEPLIIGQLEGHDTFRKAEQINQDDYVVGRVKAVVGPILFINLREPQTIGDKTYFDFHIEGSAAPGDDVIFRREGDSLVFAGVAHPAWISRLKLKEVDSASRRSAIWKELEETKEFGLPPLPPEQRTFTREAVPEPAPAPVREPAPAPIRGLW
jgi:hypothetical protein